MLAGHLLKREGIDEQITRGVASEGLVTTDFNPLLNKNQVITNHRFDPYHQLFINFMACKMADVYTR
jgi:hypothetical protein